MLLALAQTNLAETMEYIQVNIPYAGIAVGVTAVLLLGWLIYHNSRFSFDRVESVSRKTWFAMLGLFIVNLGLCGLSIGGTRIAQVYAETYETLQSFHDFQKIVEARRNMRIKDPEIIEKLKAAPDGVYVLVIGESLTRDHMNVYGYERDTTPFQSQAAIDPHYVFFNHAYSCYTQTVQVLTEALTEKNQYNDMALANAYSIIDMARRLASIRHGFPTSPASASGIRRSAQSDLPATTSTGSTSMSALMSSPRTTIQCLSRT